jgi:DNA-binding NarL/FixJ family response regulator
MVTVAAVDDHPLILHGLRAYLVDNAPDLVLDAVHPSVTALLAVMTETVDVVLLDLLLPGERDVADNVARIRAAGAAVVIFTSESRPGIVREAVDAGALGLVLKGDPESRLVEAVRMAAAGEFFVSSRMAHTMVTDPRAEVRLSAREREVLTLVARGLPHKLIAKQLGISEQTLPSYLRRVGRRYADVDHALSGTGELVAAALEDGHIELRPDRSGE